MSRIGNNPITIPSGVEINIDNNNFVSVKGPKGELSFQFSKTITIERQDDQLVFSRHSEQRQERALHGTTRAIINNMIEGVTKQFTKELDIVGVGYRATLKGNILNLTLGKSHPDDLVIPEGLTIVVPKNNNIIITGCDKQLVGEFAANIRKLRAPEPYLGKGIRYKGERVKIKEGKTAKK